MRWTSKIKSPPSPEPVTTRNLFAVLHDSGDEDDQSPAPLSPNSPDRRVSFHPSTTQGVADDNRKQAFSARRREVARDQKARGTGWRTFWRAPPPPADEEEASEFAPLQSQEEPPAPPTERVVAEPSPSPAPASTPLRAEAEAFVPRSPPAGLPAPSAPSPRPPDPPLGFRVIKVVRDVLAHLFRDCTFSLGQLRLAQGRIGADGKKVDPRPSSRSVREMFDPRFCACGADELPAGDHDLSLRGLDSNHRRHCLLCQGLGEGIHPDCYFATLRRTVSHGYMPAQAPDSSGIPSPLYVGSGSDGNLQSADVFMDALRPKVAKLLQKRVISSSPDQSDWAGRVQNPHGMNLPKSKKKQLELLTQVKVRDTASWNHAQAIMAERYPHLPPSKMRPIIDMTGSGVNATLDPRAFSQAGLSEALALMTPGCFMGVVDIEGYFHNFPYAQEFRDKTAFKLDGEWLRYNRVAMGDCTAPGFTCTWTAELVASINGTKSPCATAFFDDYWYMGADQAACIVNQQTVESVITTGGFSLAKDKHQGPSQQVTYLGFLLNSVNMTVSVMPDRAAAFLLCLQEFIAVISQGGDLSRSTMQHVAGKLEDFASIVQLGKTRVSSSWLYLKYGRDLSAHGRQQLILDWQWWLPLLEAWASGAASGREYPIENGARLAANTDLIHVVVTDMSGDDGVGAYYGSLDESDPVIYSARWPDGLRPPSSFVGELMALCDHLEQLWAAQCAWGTDLTRAPQYVLWVTDSLGAAQAANAGRCRDPAGRVLLGRIFELCDRLHVTLLGLWHYRDCNTLADFLSHLAANLDRDSVRGRVSDWPEGSTPSGGARGGWDRGEEEHQDRRGPLSGIRDLLCDPRVPRGVVRVSDVLPCGLHGQESGPHGIAVRRPEQPPDAAQPPRAGVPLPPRRRQGQEAPRGVEEAGRVGSPTQGPPAIPPPAADHRSDGPDQGLATAAGDPTAPSHAGGPAHQGDHVGPPRGGCGLEAGPGGGDPPGPHQNLQGWSRRLDRGGRLDPRALSVQAAEAPVRGPQPPAPPRRLRLLPNPPRRPVTGGQELGARVEEADQDLRRCDRPGPCAVLGALGPRRRRHRPLRRGTPVLRH